jgi:ATP-dependent protease ClpP protease subunit
MSNSWYAFANKTADSADVEIYDEIGGYGVSAKEFIKGLKDVEGKHLNLRINSPGGSIIDGQAIISALKRHSAGFTAYVDGLAASMASVIACAAEKCFMADGAMMMIHRASTVSMGDASDLRKDADLLEKFEKGLIGVYSKKTGMDEAELSKMLDEETWMDSLEAVALGFADGITDNTPAMASISQKDLRARFDNFKNGMASNNAPTESEVASPEPEIVAPIVEEVPASDLPAEVLEQISEETGVPVEEIETVGIEEASVSEPSALINADSFIAKFNEIQAIAAANMARAEAAEGKLHSVLDQLAKLESSLGLAASKNEAKVAPASVPAEDKTMKFDDFQKLVPAAKSTFMRSGGRLTE